MNINLLLEFRTHEIVNVILNGQEAGSRPFKVPFTEYDYEDLKWYLEIYSNQYTTDVDDARATRIREQLVDWGKTLYHSVFDSDNLENVYKKFIDSTEATHTLTICSDQGTILGLPWELMCNPQDEFLLQIKPTISVVRSLPHEFNAALSTEIKTNNALRVLFVVSRPEGVGFIDPQSDVRPVLEVLDEMAPNDVAIEFLRPPTLRQLVNRLKDNTREKIDVLHFDGHGIFDSGSDEGYLFFTRPGSETIHRVSGALLAQHLKGLGLQLVVLSACQSAVTPGGDAMGAVAAQLLHSGIPSVLGMSYSVRAQTTRQFFVEFYQALLDGKSPIDAINRARIELLTDPHQQSIERAGVHTTITVHDWFVPTLYHVGNVNLPIHRNDRTIKVVKIRSNLPSRKTLFVGRKRELWDIERWFTAGSRQIIVSGPVQYGKSMLIKESAGWLLRTGMFNTAVLVDGTLFKNSDYLYHMRKLIAAVLGCSAELTAIQNALSNQSVIILYDQGESLSEQVSHELIEELINYSSFGNTRLLIAQRDSKLSTKRLDNKYHLQIQGLDPESGLELFRQSWRKDNKYLPKRSELIELLQTGDFQPCYIELLASGWDKIKERLPEKILLSLNTQQGFAEWIAPVQAVFESMPTELQTWMPVLSVFEEGGMEDRIVVGTGLIRLTEEQGPEKALNAWIRIRQTLMSAGLVHCVSVFGTEFLYVRFHPALLPVLREELSADEWDALKKSHTANYLRLAIELYQHKEQEPEKVNAITAVELANIFVAAIAILRDPLYKGCTKTVDPVLALLKRVGLRADNRKQRLLRAVRDLSHAPEEWYLRDTALAEEFHQKRSFIEEQQVIESILARLGPSPSYERCVMMQKLGRCQLGRGQQDLAANTYRKMLDEVELLTDESVKPDLRAGGYTDLGEALQEMGETDKAKEHYLQALDSSHAINDIELVTLLNARLGSLAQDEGDLEQAEKQWLSNVNHCRQLKDDDQLAGSLQRLGWVYECKGSLEDAENAYRESAQLLESLGFGAGFAWNRLALLNINTQHWQQAIAFTRKAVEAHTSDGNYFQSGANLYNLASLLMSENALDKAEDAANQAVTAYDKAEANISDVSRLYDLLIDIAQKKADAKAAKNYREQLIERKSAFFANIGELKPHRDLIAMVLAAIHRPKNEVQNEFNEIKRHQAEMRRVGGDWALFADALDLYLRGTREYDLLQIDEQGFVQQLLLKALVSGAKDPESVLRGLFDERVQTAKTTNKGNESMNNVDQLIDEFLASGNPDTFQQILEHVNKQILAIHTRSNVSAQSEAAVNRYKDMFQASLAARVDSEPDAEKREKLKALSELLQMYTQMI